MCRWAACGCTYDVNKDVGAKEVEQAHALGHAVRHLDGDVNVLLHKDNRREDNAHDEKRPGGGKELG